MRQISQSVFPFSDFQTSLIFEIKVTLGRSSEVLAIQNIIEIDMAMFQRFFVTYSPANKLECFPFLIVSAKSNACV